MKDVIFEIIVLVMIMILITTSGCVGMRHPDSMTLSTRYDYQDWKHSNMGEANCTGIGLSFTWNF